MNKKLLTIVITALLTIFLGRPTNSFGGSIQYGLRGGFNLANVNGDVYLTEAPELMEFEIVEDLIIMVAPDTVSYENEFHSGYCIGGFLEYWFSSSLALQLNALYSQKGTKVETTIKGRSFDPSIGFTVTQFFEMRQAVKLSYISFPIMAKYVYGGNSAGLRPFFMAGPEISFIESAKLDPKKGSGYLLIPSLDGIGLEVDEPGRDIKDEMNSVEIAFNFGAGVTFPIGNMSAFLDARYGLGLTDNNKEGDDGNKNNVIYFNLGLFF